MVTEYLLIVVAALAGAMGTHKGIGKLSVAFGGKERKPAVQASGSGAVFLIIMLGGYFVLTNEPPAEEVVAEAEEVEEIAPEEMETEEAPSLSTEGDRSPAVGGSGTEGDRSPSIIGGGDITITN